MENRPAMKIVCLDTDTRWDDFVAAHPLGTIYQHSAWKEVLQTTFGHRPFYLYLEHPDTGRIEGIMPFMLIKSRLTGDRLVSLPFTSYCSRLIPASEVKNIVEFALRAHPEVELVELKFLEPLEETPDILQTQSKYITHILDLGPDPDELLMSFHDTSVRQRIRRAERSDLKLRMAAKEEDLKDFYRLYTRVRRKHGLPPHPYSFFVNMWRILGPRNFLLVPLVEYQGKVIAGAIVLKFQDTFHFEYSASDSDYLKLSPNPFIIWQTIKIACAQGAKHFDFGRSSLSNASLIDFKERWGAERHNLAYYYYPEAKGVDTANGGTVSRSVMFVNKILPLALLRLEGELVYRHLG